MPSEMTPEERRVRASLAAHTLWATVEDPVEFTAKGRKAAMERFEKQVDPDGVLPPDERARRAEHDSGEKDTRQFCQRCGMAREPGDLRKTVVQAGALSLLDEVELLLCSKCRKILSGKGTP